MGPESKQQQSRCLKTTAEDLYPNTVIKTEASKCTAHLQGGGTFPGPLAVRSHSRKAGALAKPLNSAVYPADGKEH